MGSVCREVSEVQEVSEVREMPEAMCCVLFCMLESVEGVLSFGVSKFPLQSAACGQG